MDNQEPNYNIDNEYVKGHVGLNNSSEEQATWKQYLKSKEFFVLIGSILGGILLFVLFFFYLFLPFFTKHGQSVTVPELVNLKLDKAAEKLSNEGLYYEVQDSQYVENLPPLSIISQEPLPFEKVKPGRKVYLVVNQMSPTLIKLPDIIDVNLQQCRYMLENWKLKMGNLTYKPGIAKDAIISASFKGKEIKPGDKIQEGSVIDLVVSKGLGDEKVSIPNLVGMNLNEASSLLFSKGLSVGEKKYQKNNKEAGIINKQFPKFEQGDSVVKGQAFDLWINGEEKKE